MNDSKEFKMNDEIDKTCRDYIEATAAYNKALIECGKARISRDDMKKAND